MVRTSEGSLIVAVVMGLPAAVVWAGAAGVEQRQDGKARGRHVGHRASLRLRPKRLQELARGVGEVPGATR